MPLRSLFFLLCILLPFTAFGQGSMLLTDGLKKLNQKRGTYFLYNPQHLKNQRVASPDWRLATEAVLTNWLQGTGLTYRRVGDCYLIETAQTTPLAAPVRTLTPARRVTVSGYVREANSGEHLAGATVFVGNRTGTATNTYGYFALSLPADDEVDLIVSLVGYQRTYRRLRTDEDQTLDLDLTNNDGLNEVVLTAEANERAGSSIQTSQHTPTMATLRNSPAVGGERDILRTLQGLPGIQKGLDGQVGLHVRGGGADQNLLILDDAPVYNANHLFGFLSVFNADALKSVQVQKGGFSSRYGGRLSSVVEMNMREGNRQRLSGELGTGLIASQAMIEGPLIRDKASFLLTARRSNFDPMLGRFVAGLVNAYTGADWKANFYDLNAKVNVDLDRRNQLYISGYMGRDRFSGGDSLDRSREWQNVIGWGNATGTVRWNHLYNERLFSNLSLVYSQYDFNTETRFIPYELAALTGTPGTPASSWRHFNHLTDYALRYDLDFFPSEHHQIRAGASVNERMFRLDGHVVDTPDSPQVRSHEQRVGSLETAIYAEDDWTISNRLRLTIGGRLTRYHVQDRTFWRPEPRVSVGYSLSDRLSVRASYAEMNQFVHQLTNTGQGLPTDLWVPANGRVEPQRSRQGVVAVVANLTPRWQLSVEAYRKVMTHIIGYRPNADFIGVTNALDAERIRWERNVTSGAGDATGLEVLLQRKTGRLSGWLAYTCAVTNWQLDELNNGRAFYPTHDRRHTLTLNGSFAVSPTFRLSGMWQYSSGNPQSVAVLRVPTYTHLGLGKPGVSGEPIFGNGEPYIAGRQSVNSFRAEPFHRLDLSAQKTLSTGRLTHRVDLTLTNTYGRRNPFYYQYHPEGDATAGLKRVSLFIFLPSLTYTVRF